MKSIKSMMMGGAILFSLSMMFTSCEGALDDILGEWSRPTPGNNTPSGGGSDSGGDSDSGGGSSTVVASSLSITETTLRLDKSTSQTLTLNVTPADATVTWESKDETVATVDASGKVTPKKAGKVTITAKSGDLDDTSTIYIYDKIWNINTDGNADVTAGESWLIKGSATTPVANSITIGAGATVTLNGINITQQLSCSGDATIILADGSENKVNAPDYKAGIKIGSGATTTLTIDAENAGTGQLTVKGGEDAAGIGTDLNLSGGNITINGGTVTATGGNYGAGIGTGTISTANYECGNITINGGTVTATGGKNGAGIGTGQSQWAHTNKCGDITIGTGIASVKATRGSNSDIIGKGKLVSGTQICGKIIFGTAEVFDGSAWSPATMVAGTYGGLNLAISGDDWTLTPAP